jgi:hypothetical protein
MACEEATFNRRHSAVSEDQNQHQHQKRFTAEDAEDAKENKQNQHQQQRPFTTEGTEAWRRSGNRVIGSSENQNLPRMSADCSRQSARTEIFLPQRAQRRSGNRDIGISGHLKTKIYRGWTRMDADERGLQGEESSRESEFVPVLGGYGFERVSLRIEPELGGQRRPVQPVINTKDPAQVHANLGWVGMAWDIKVGGGEHRVIGKQSLYPPDRR